MNLRQALEFVPKGYLEATTREEMQKILDDRPEFKRSRFKFGSAEQDGFFLRVIEYFGWKTSFPEKPPCNISARGDTTAKATLGQMELSSSAFSGAATLPR